MRILSKKKTAEVIEILNKTYPDAKCELNHSTPFELLVATILSAQCTDVRVNMVTEELFKKYNTPQQFEELGATKIEPLIRTCGFYRNKARSIYGASKMILDEYGGEVPNTIEELVKLPGVGKKTANVVASNCFDIPAIAVDTHVFRVSNRIGIVNEKTPEKTEEALMKRIDKDMWTKAHHLIIFHGRRRCMARNPDCGMCEVREYCNWIK